MAKPIITILGLGTLGASLGLALQRSAAQAEIVGHDKVPEASQLARKNNVVQRVEWNLHAACEPASLIVLAMPVGEIAETLELIREDVQPNALVFVLSDVLQPAAQMIEEKLGGDSQRPYGLTLDLDGVLAEKAARPQDCHQVGVTGEA